LVNAWNTHNSCKYRKLRPEQLAFSEFSLDKTHCILQAPCGWGKTEVAKYIAAHAMCMDDLSNKKIMRAHIFIVPLKHLMKSYSAECNFEHETGLIKFSIPASQRYSVDEKKIAKFKDFIVSKNTHRNNAAILTHQGFCMMWFNLSKQEQKNLLKNTTFYIDECHHLTEPGESDDATRLGKIIDIIMKVNEPTCRIMLMTATLYRGDFKSLLSKENYKKFLPGHGVIPFEDYFKKSGIKHFNYDYIIYNVDAINELITLIKKHPDKKHIIVLPRRGSKGRKRDTHKKYLDALRKVIPPERVLDLINPKFQKEGLGKLKDNPEEYDVVLSCNVFVEGSDWPPASVVHNLSFGNSLLKVNQIIGRVMRIYVGKDCVNIYSYIKTDKGEDLDRRIYTDRFNALMVVILAEDMIKSIKLPELPRFKNYVVRNTIPDAVNAALHEYAVKNGIHIIAEDKDTEMIKIYIDQMTERLFSESKKIKIKGEHLVDIDLIRYFFKTKKDLRDHLRALFIKDIMILSGAPREKIEGITLEFIRGHFDEICEKQMNECANVFGTRSGIETETFKTFRKMIEPFKKEIFVLEGKSCATPITETKKRFPTKTPPISVVDLQDKWVRIIGSNEIGRIISLKPLTVRIYDKAVIDDLKVLCGKYKYCQIHGTWVLKHETKNDCINKRNMRKWKNDKDFGIDKVINESDITFTYPLEEVSL
jgi:superfamily II DNA or RNA helicase